MQLTHYRKSLQDAASLGRKKASDEKQDTFPEQGSPARSIFFLKSLESAI
jgi:hypothetical protein